MEDKLNEGLTEEEQDFMEMIINWQMENPKAYERIKAFADISISRATLFSALADYSNIKQSILVLVDEMIKENQAFFGDYTIKTLTELKQKIEEL